jgi:hypothetical protein
MDYEIWNSLLPSVLSINYCQRKQKCWKAYNAWQWMNTNSIKFP